MGDCAHEWLRRDNAPDECRLCGAWRTDEQYHAEIDDLRASLARAESRMVEAGETIAGLRAALRLSERGVEMALRHLSASCSRCDDGIQECPCTCLSGPGVGDVYSALDEARSAIRAALKEG